MQNYLWNMFTNIRNGQISKKAYVLQQLKKNCEPFLKILWNEGFILGYNINKKTNTIIILLKYSNKGIPAINSIKLVSKPGKKLYYSAKQLWKIDSNSSFLILSTTKGIKSIIECKNLKIGGEPYIVIN
jgi:small subunit ribosomal protein S8